MSQDNQHLVADLDTSSNVMRACEKGSGQYLDITLASHTFRGLLYVGNCSSRNGQAVSTYFAPSNTARACISMLRP